ncbi:MAG: CPBP family intramembrane glutamic endopeptidase [Bacteroidota bacterium]
MDQRPSSGVGTDSTQAVGQQVAWWDIGAFYAIALLIAAPFNAGVTDSWLRDTFPGTPLAEWTFLPAALGPALAATILRTWGRRTPRHMTVLGVGVRQNLFASILPVVVFASIGGIGVVLPCVALVYALGEELGWRGYLADALGSLPASARYGLTALLWWPWHLRFETTFDWVGFPLIVLASCWVLGHAAKETNSVLVAAAMHAAVILLTANGPPTGSLALAGGITLGGWILAGMLFPVDPSLRDAESGTRAAP